MTHMNTATNIRNAPQLSARAIGLSIVLAMVLAAANTYLGLFAGLTIATAIPAAVVSMAVAVYFGGTGHMPLAMIGTALFVGLGGLTFELAVRLLRRHLEETEPAGVKQLPFDDLVRLGAERGLIDSPVDWFGFREKRYITPDRYDEGKAEQIYAALPAFAARAVYLLAALERMNSRT